MTTDATLDEDRLAELAEDLGADDLTLVLAMFLEEAEAEASKLARGQPDAERRKSGHFLRSGALNLGLAGLSEAAEAVHMTDGVGRAAAVAAVRAAIDATRDALGPRAVVAAA